MTGREVLIHMGFLFVDEENEKTLFKGTARERRSHFAISYLQMYLVIFPHDTISK